VLSTSPSFPTFLDLKERLLDGFDLAELRGGTSVARCHA